MASRGAAYVLSTFYKYITSTSGKVVAIEFVDKTTAWIRPAGLPAQSVKDDFVDVAQDNLHKFKPETKIITMKETEHVSPGDPFDHYTAYGLDEHKDPVKVQHLNRKKKLA